ncbi:SAM-dependent methyltransferase, partial [Clostridium botulinum]|nr:SAM-dependent methyltransferase [Clostridium botulinum]
MEKLFLKKFLKSIFSDTFEVQFWDGTGEKFGEGDIKFKIIINEHLSKSDILKD